jgi:hypothetical protein
MNLSKSGYELLEWVMNLSESGYELSQCFTALIVLVTKTSESGYDVWSFVQRRGLYGHGL